MLLTGIIVVSALLGLVFALVALRHFRRRRIIRTGVHGLLAVVFLLAATATWLLTASLRTYQRLTHEQVAGEILLKQTGERAFHATVTLPDGTSRQFDLRGDEWQVDARVLKWHGLANVAGFDTVYRLERLSGRYTDIESERREPRTVYGLQAAGRFDPWSLARRYKPYLPWIDALYGSAAFLPMAEGALYEISVSQTGLLARPLNQAAKQAVGGWR
jgi:hypothetical protein